MKSNSVPTSWKKKKIFCSSGMKLEPMKVGSIANTWQRIPKMQICGNMFQNNMKRIIIASNITTKNRLTDMHYDIASQCMSVSPW